VHRHGGHRYAGKRHPHPGGPPLRAGDVAIPITTSAIPVRGFDNDVTEVIAIVLADRQAGVLLENGWNITSVRTGFAEEDPNREQGYIDVEFRSDELPLSFFIEVDEEEKQTGKGRCNATVRDGRPGAGPLPEYHQAAFKSRDHQRHVFERNERVMMIYSSTTIFYLYPSYAIVDMEGILD
jgi:hypothetical protein